MHVDDPPALTDLEHQRVRGGQLRRGVPTERIGYEVFGDTINSGGSLIVDAVRVGNDTALAQIARLVEDAQRLGLAVSSVGAVAAATPDALLLRMAAGGARRRYPNRGPTLSYAPDIPSSFGCTGASA